MRKCFAFLFVAFCAWSFSSPVLAGKYDDECADFRGEKRLYGLCNAYQNALFHEDEEAMADIFSNWQKWVDEDGLPLLPNHDYGAVEDSVVEDPVCPCWPDGELALRSGPLDCEVNFDQAFVIALYWDLGGSGDFIQYGVGSVIVDDMTGETEPNSCEYVFNLSERQMTGMTDAQYESCLRDISGIIESDFPLDQFPNCDTTTP